MKQLWDGSKKIFGPCACGATLYMEGVIDPDGPQVYVFCDTCGSRQGMISRELSPKDIAWATRRARELSKGPVCCVS